MKTLLFSLLILSISFSSFSQGDSNVSLVMLGNDKIADVNLDSDKYLKDIGLAIDAFEDETKDISKNQKIAVLITLHKDINTTFQVYSNPKLSDGKESSLLAKMSAIKMGNSRYVDFPVVIGINVGQSLVDVGIAMPHEKMKKEYESANLEVKLEMNKK